MTVFIISHSESFLSSLLSLFCSLFTPISLSNDKKKRRKRERKRRERKRKEKKQKRKEEKSRGKKRERDEKRRKEEKSLISPSEGRRR
jgi:hypothetical protein